MDTPAGRLHHSRPHFPPIDDIRQRQRRRRRRLFDSHPLNRATCIGPVKGLARSARFLLGRHPEPCAYCCPAATGRLRLANLNCGTHRQWCIRPYRRQVLDRPQYNSQPRAAVSSISFYTFSTDLLSRAAFFTTDPSYMHLLWCYSMRIRPMTTDYE